MLCRWRCKKQVAADRAQTRFSSVVGFRLLGGTGQKFHPRFPNLPSHDTPLQGVACRAWLADEGRCAQVSRIQIRGVPNPDDRSRSFRSVAENVCVQASRSNDGRYSCEYRPVVDGHRRAFEHRINCHCGAHEFWQRNQSEQNFCDDPQSSFRADEKTFEIVGSHVLDHFLALC